MLLSVFFTFKMSFIKKLQNKNCPDTPNIYTAIVRPIGERNSGKETMACNRITVREINSSNLANHHFQTKTEVKDFGIEEMFKKMYNQDYCEDKLVTLDQSVKQSCDSIISWEDKKCLNLMNGTTKIVSSQYELPLPFKTMTQHCQITDFNRYKD